MTDRLAAHEYIANQFTSIFHCPFIVTTDDETETIHASAYDGSHEYTMTITSDDDEYLFYSDTDDQMLVRFPIPE